jgi:lipopolysaccharide/colanic/teichoic acid biosynthesis glycosyltransferase
LHWLKKHCNFTNSHANEMDVSLKTVKKVFYNIIFDIGSMFGCLTILSLIKYSHNFEKLYDFNILFGSYAILILLLSVIFDKYELKRKYGFYKILNKYFFAWILTTIIILITILLYDLNFYRWIYILISFVSLLIFEVILISIRFTFRYAKFVEDRHELKHSILMRESLRQEEAMDDINEEDLDDIKIHTPDFLKDMIPFEAIQNKNVRKLIERNTTTNPKLHIFVNTINRHLFLSYRNHSLELIVNTFKVNNLRYINKFLEIINIKLKRGGKLVICVETLKQRRERHNKKYPLIIRPIHVLFEFCVHRVWPRLPFLRKSYYWLWKKNSKRISYAETLGRLYSCGFEYVEEIISEGLTWLVVRKKDRPLLSFDVTYSPVIKLKRIGKGGKIIAVYKMRTMHPYSEFLQDFIYKNNKLSKGGKFKDDFRISGWGHLMRKLWIDELPMIINLLKGDLKIVGVRPLSLHYFNLYPHEIQKKRIKYKPGLLPPFYVDMPNTLDEIVASESKYLDQYSKAHFTTDFKYFWKILWNIVVKRARSK